MLLNALPFQIHKATTAIFKTNVSLLLKTVQLLFIQPGVADSKDKTIL